MSEEIKIFTAPKPDSLSRSRSTLPVAKLRPGTDDCFDFPKKRKVTVYQVARYHGIKVTVRDLGNGFMRVWRVS